ncbi:hypothetical protein D9M69_436720 [compost metagenome]
MLVASTTLRLPGGAGSMAARWAERSSSPCSRQSRISSRPASDSPSCSATRRISACPGRNTNRLPGSSARAWSTVCTTRGSTNSPTCQGRPQRMSTGNIRPSLRTTSASLSILERRSPSSVADITKTLSGVSLSSSRPLRVNAKARSASKLRSWYSSMMTRPTPSSAGSSCKRLVRIPSVTTSMRVSVPTLLSNRIR